MRDRRCELDIEYPISTTIADGAMSRAKARVVHSQKYMYVHEDVMSNGGLPLARISRLIF